MTRSTVCAASRSTIGGLEHVVGTPLEQRDLASVERVGRTRRGRRIWSTVVVVYEWWSTSWLTLSAVEAGGRQALPRSPRPTTPMPHRREHTTSRPPTASAATVPRLGTTISRTVASRPRGLVELAVQREQATHHRQRQQVEPVQHADDEQDAGDARGLVLELRRVDGLAPSSRRARTAS